MSSVSLNTNLAALRAQRRLGESTSQVRGVFERLASGMRIVRASDDAAGLSIASGLNTDARVFSQGIMNFNDGVGLISVADGALEQLSTITTRLRELATQSANGTFSLKQRRALDGEAQQLAKEYTRIVRSTTFNGQTLFDYRFGTLSLQGGFGTRGTIASGLGGSVGNGSFSVAQTLAVASPWEPTVADFNRDGIQDLLLSQAGGSTVSVLLGNSDGTFQSALSVGSGGLTPYTATVGDFNGDGNADIVSANYGAASVGVCLGNGNGTFQQVQTYSVDSHPNGIVSGDFNGDGRQDIAVTNETNGNIGILLGNGNGTFQAQVTYSVGGATSPNGLRAADFNGDGITDLATSKIFTGSIGVLLGSGNGSFTTLDVPLSGSATPGAVACGDFNGDGKADIVASDQGAPGLQLLLGNGNGTFQSPTILTTGGYSPGIVTLGDFNGDGNADLATTANNDSLVLTYIGDGRGNFQSPQSILVGTNPWGLAVGDFNGDGVQDLVTGDSTASTISVLHGTAVSGVGPLPTFDLTTRYQALEAMSTFDKALKRIVQQRGSLGAFLSRLATGTNNLTQIVENNRSAASRIMDSDVATDAALLTRQQLLQQASSAILAQANTLPELALQLLRGN